MATQLPFGVSHSRAGRAPLLPPTLAQPGSLVLTNEVGAQLWELAGLPLSVPHERLLWGSFRSVRRARGPLRAGGGSPYGKGFLDGPCPWNRTAEPGHSHFPPGFLMQGGLMQGTCLWPSGPMELLSLTRWEGSFNLRIHGSRLYLDPHDRPLPERLS